jgi:hypothetical protein
MNDEKMQVGARVRLRSDGTEMVVERVVGRTLHVSWQDGDRRLVGSYTAPSVDLVRPAARR